MCKTSLALKNRELCISRRMPAPAGFVWEVLTDTLMWRHWGPSVRNVACSTRYIRENSRGYIQTVIGLWLPFAITEYEYQHYWRWRIYSIKATGHTISDHDYNSCSLTFSMPWWSAPYAAICFIALRRIERILLRHLSRFSLQQSILPETDNRDRP